MGEHNTCHMHYSNALLIHLIARIFYTLKGHNIRITTLNFFRYIRGMAKKKIYGIPFPQENVM